MKRLTVPRLTITITDEQDALLNEKTGDCGKYESKSEAVRSFIQRGEEATRRIDALENENERLRRQLQARNAREDDVTELVEYVEQERTLRERREERRDAPAWTRAKWWLLGR